MVTFSMKDKTVGDELGGSRKVDRITRSPHSAGEKR